jgi:hypothetical protein
MKKGLVVFWSVYERLQLFGTKEGRVTITKLLGLESTLRRRGRL